MNINLLTPEVIEELKRTNATVLLVDSDIPCYSIGFMAKDDSSPKHVENSVDNFLLKMKRKLEATHYMCFLTDGRSNFRNQRATTDAYKGNREGLERPQWYGHIKDYLQNKWKAQLMIGIEADDALTLAATYLSMHGIKWIICSLDKDLRQMPGMHYDWTADKLFEVTPQKAERNFWKQMIIGDVATDNIPGLSDSAWEPNGPFRTPVFTTELRVPTEGAHLHTTIRPIKVAGEPKTVQPMVPKGKSVVSSRGLRSIYGADYLDYFDNILDETGKCQGLFSPVEYYTPAPIKMAHAVLTGWEEVTDLTYVRGLAEDYYGETRALEMLDALKPEQYAEKILEEYISAYWEEAEVQELDDPATLGEQRFNEVFDLVYMLRVPEEIPEYVRDTVKLDMTPLVFQAKDYDDFAEDDVDADDPDFDF